MILKLYIWFRISYSCWEKVEWAKFLLNHLYIFNRAVWRHLMFFRLSYIPCMGNWIRWEYNNNYFKRNLGSDKINLCQQLACIETSANSPHNTSHHDRKPDEINENIYYSAQLFHITDRKNILGVITISEETVLRLLLFGRSQSTFLYQGQ